MSTETGTGTEAYTDVRDCNDVDTHEMVPLHKWEETFGDEVREFVELCRNMDLSSHAAENTIRRDELDADATEITDATVWELKGPDAPGAFDLRRRHDVMDAQGTRRQLMFPGFGLRGMMLLYEPNAPRLFGFDPTQVDLADMGRTTVRAHNAWCVRTTRDIGATRVRPVAFVLIDSVESMVAQAEELIAQGIRAVLLPSGLPPAGMSPADRRLDPFWRLMAESRTTVTMHVGVEFPLLSSPAWGVGVPEFANSMGSSLEFVLQPYWGATVNFASENYLTAMVLGGVFERHPELRFGSIEVGARWLGPLAERLDMWAELFRTRLFDSGSLTMKPSAYLNRNVRVAPYYFEPVDTYFDRYPEVADCYCFASDYPHREGGRRTKEAFYNRLAPLGTTVVRKFFTENGSWLLPD